MLNIKNFGELKGNIISLHERKNRFNSCLKQMKRKNINGYKFHLEYINKNRILGNKVSHLNIINLNFKSGNDKVFILEDDFKLMGSLDNIPEPPSDWDILYLGGEVLRKLENKKETKLNDILRESNKSRVPKNFSKWIRVVCRGAHAYIVNLNNKQLVNELNNSLKYKGKLWDYYLSDFINLKYKCYILDPMIMVQNDGNSDIHNRYINYNMEKSTHDYIIPEHRIKKGNYILKMPDILEKDLPTVSIITVSHKNRDIFSLTLKNYGDILYPKNKIEWIIIEDTPKKNSEMMIKDLIPGDQNIKYIYLDSDIEGIISVNKKREIGVENSKNDIIFFMDDNVLYSSESIYARVKLLVKYPHVGAIGTDKIGYYDIFERKSYMVNSDNMELKSMGFKRKFIENKTINDNLLEKDKIINIPHSFICYGLLFDIKNIEGNNISGSLKAQDLYNFYNHWIIEDKIFMDNLGNYLEKKYEDKK